jgi:hypothetical protein
MPLRARAVEHLPEHVPHDIAVRSIAWAGDSGRGHADAAIQLYSRSRLSRAASRSASGRAGSAFLPTDGVVPPPSYGGGE